MVIDTYHEGACKHHHCGRLESCLQIKSTISILFFIAASMFRVFTNKMMCIVHSKAFSIQIHFDIFTTD